MARRKYNSELREQQALDTRRRILEAAGRITLLDLGRVTHAAVARAAGISERTVYRHFPSVAELHEAFAKHQEKRFDSEYPDELSLDDLPAMYERWPDRLSDELLIEHMREERDPPMVTKNRRERYQRIERAVARLAPDATPTQVQQVVLVLGALMSPETIRRGIKIFELEPAEVVPGPAWAIRTLIESLRNGDTPWT